MTILKQLEIVLVTVLLQCSVGVAQTAPAQKKLIEFGWDEPDTAFMRAHIAEMEKTPFDGTVCHAMYRNADGTAGTFMNDCWSKRTFTAAELAGAKADLEATPLHRLTENFLRFNVSPGDVDWFDDFSAVVSNAKLAGQLAAAGKAKGILFDTEQYVNQLFDYSKQRDAKTKSFDQYAAQVRQRGREVMTAFQEGEPDLTVFLTFAYSLSHAQVGVDKTKLATVNYGLLPSFLDGMFDAAKGKARIVDGFEMSYGYKTRAQFEKIPAIVEKDVLPLVGVKPEQYWKHVSLGFGLWMDNDWRTKGWSVADFSKNYFTPEEFEASLRSALATTDEYVWIYTEEPRWWTAKGTSEKLPEAYVGAVRRAVGK